MRGVAQSARIFSIHNGGQSAIKTCETHPDEIRLRVTVKCIIDITACCIFNLNLYTYDSEAFGASATPSLSLRRLEPMTISLGTVSRAQE